MQGPYNGFELESPNFHQLCSLRFSQLVLKMRVIDFDLQGHLAISNSEKRHRGISLKTKRCHFDDVFHHWLLHWKLSEWQLPVQPVMKISSVWRMCRITQSRMKRTKYRHDDVIRWKDFPRYWPFVRGIHRWIPLTNAIDAELWCFLWSAPEQTVEQTIETLFF